jgi:hypothetical protein
MLQLIYHQVPIESNIFINVNVNYSFPSIANKTSNIQWAQMSEIYKHKMNLFHLQLKLE